MLFTLYLGSLYSVTSSFAIGPRLFHDHVVTRSLTPNVADCGLTAVVLTDLQNIHLY
jgi:hypothetical protein